MNPIHSSAQTSDNPTSQRTWIDRAQYVWDVVQEEERKEKIRELKTERGAERNARTESLYESLSQPTLVHLTALAVILTNTIQAERSERTNPELSDHSMLFSFAYIKQTQARIDPHHNPQHCLERRQELSPDPDSVTMGTCRRCRTLFNWKESLRFNKVRRKLWWRCCVLTDVCRTSILCCLVNCYVKIRWVILDTCRKRHTQDIISEDVDIYLFLQMTFALVELHNQRYIWLTFQSIERYIVLFTLFFAHCYSDLIHYVYWQHLFESLLKDYWPCLLEFRRTYALLASLVFTRGHMIQNKYLFMEQSPDAWNTFVFRVNQHPDIVSLCRHYKMDALFMDEKPEREEEGERRNGEDSSSMDILTFEK